MTLRQKTFLIVGVTALCLIVAVYAVVSAILTRGFENLERDWTLLNVQRVREVYELELENLSTKLSDWAIWDDTYRFIKDRNSAYVESNLSPTALSVLKINAMVFVDREGEVVVAVGQDLDSDREVPVPKSLFSHLTPGSPLLTHQSLDATHRGLLLLPEGPFMFAAHPILTSQGEGPIAGTLLFGRFLDDKQVTRLVSVTHLSINVTPFSPQLPDELQQAANQLTSQPEYTRPLSETTIAGYAILSDFYGQHALLVKVESPRDIYQQGQRSIRYLVVSLIASGATFLFLSLWLLDFLILSRLGKLSQAVNIITQKKDLSGRIPQLPGNDELERLSDKINVMLEQLEETQHKLHEEQEKAQSYVDIAEVMIIVIGRDEKVLMINKKGCQVLGREKADVVGKNWFDAFLPERIRGEVRQKFGQLMKGEISPVEYVENQVVTARGEERLIVWHNSVVVDHEGHVLASVSSGEDITEKKASEVKMQGYTKELERLNRVMVGRELKMMKLKQEIEELKNKPENG